MDSRERVKLALSFQKPDRLPFNFWMDRRLMAQYEEELGGPYWRTTRYGADVWESFALIPWQVPVAEYEMRDGTAWAVKPSFDSVEQLASVALPDVESEAVYSMIQSDRAALPEVFMTGALISALGWLDGWRGYQNFFTDIYDEPEIIDHIVNIVQQTNTTVARGMIEAGVDCLYLMEDLGSTTGLLMSKDHIERYVLRCFSGALEVAKEKAIPVFFHTDGAVLDILDRFVELGVTAVNPLQPHLNDHQVFHRKYHKWLALYGAGDNTYIIPTGTPDEVRQHVFDMFELHGQEGGFIFSTHDIPLETPRENIEAMLEALRQCTY